MSTATLDQALDTAMRLPPELREMLVDILKRRGTDARRQEIAADARRSLTSFRAGEYRAQTAAEAIDELRLLLEQDE
jgi:hypothetical protein